MFLLYLVEKKMIILKIDVYIFFVEKVVEKVLWEIFYDIVIYIELMLDFIVIIDEIIELLNSNFIGGSKKKLKFKNLVDKLVKLIKELCDEKGLFN